MANNSTNKIGKFDSTGNNPVDFGSITNPIGLAFDAGGNLFASSLGSDQIRKFDSSGTDLGVFGPGLSSLAGLAFDSFGNLFVGRHSSNAIVKLDSIGNVSPFVNTGLNSPTGLVVDASDNVYAANQSDGTMTKFNRTGNATSFASGLNVPNFIAIKETSPLVPFAKVTSVSRQANHHFTLTGQTLPNALVIIQATANLQNAFITIGTATASAAGLFQYDDAGAVGMPTRFYRVSYP